MTQRRTITRSELAFIFMGKRYVLTIEEEGFMSPLQGPTVFLKSEKNMPPPPGIKDFAFGSVIF